MYKLSIDGTYIWLLFYDRDIEKHKSDDPDYSPKTLHVPDVFLNNQTPAMRQWWVLKAKHYDTVLFFKVSLFILIK